MLSKRSIWKTNVNCLFALILYLVCDVFLDFLCVMGIEIICNYKINELMNCDAAVYTPAAITVPATERKSAQISSFLCWRLLQLVL